MRLPASKNIRRYDASFEQRQANLRAFRRLLHSKGLTLVKRPEQEEYAMYWMPVCKENFVFESIIEDVAEYFESMELGD